MRPGHFVSRVHLLSYTERVGEETESAHPSGKRDAEGCLELTANSLAG